MMNDKSLLDEIFLFYAPIVLAKQICYASERWDTANNELSKRNGNITT